MMNIENIKNRKYLNNVKGNVLLTAMLILSTFSLIIAVGVALTSIDNLNIASDFIKGDLSRSLADSCGQDALVQLSRNPSYAGGTFALDDGECNIEITSPSGTTRLIQVTGSLDEYESTFQFTLDLSTLPYSIVDWERGGV